MSGTTTSIIALALCMAPALVHALEVIKPTWVQWVVNIALPIFGPGIPDKKNFITQS